MTTAITPERLDVAAIGDASQCTAPDLRIEALAGPPAFLPVAPPRLLPHRSVLSER